jgi:hypothetical protein
MYACMLFGCHLRGKQAPELLVALHCIALHCIALHCIALPGSGQESAATHELNYMVIAGVI